MLSEHIVYLALGSNIGNRVDNIHRALQEIAEFAAIETTSFLYETEPAFYTAQASFLNAVCKVITHLSPEELLDAVENTMAAMGRERTIPNGPRIIDIDILLFDDLQFESPDLVIPHPGIAERDFVLEPLCDVAKTVRHPVLNKTIFDLWRELGADNLQKVMPMGDRVWPWGAEQKTYVMGVLNRECDNAIDTLDEGVATAKRLVDEGADLLEIDAHMIAPMQTPLSIDAEISRAIPIIQAIKSAVDVPLSINTYQFQVAEAALMAGVDLINYRCNLQHAEQICTLTAGSQAPLVLTYNPKNNLCFGAYYQLSIGASYEHGDVQIGFVDAVRHELRQMRIVAKTHAVPKWLLVQNPGLSLMNERGHVIQLTKKLSEIARSGYPMLVDPTKIRLLGSEKQGEEIIALGTIAASAGASIVRTYDVASVVRGLQVTNTLRTCSTREWHVRSRMNGVH